MDYFVLNVTFFLKKVNNLKIRMYSEIYNYSCQVIDIIRIIIT